MESLLASKRLLVTLVLLMLAVVGTPLLARRSRVTPPWVAAIIIAYAVGQTLFALWGGWQRLTYPGYLNITEGASFAHLLRLRAGLPLYPAPSPDFVALAYVPGLYLAALPATWILGSTLTALRLAPCLAWLGLGLALGAGVRRVGGVWAALLAIGFYFSAYYVFDNHLDNGFADSLYLLAALLGALVVERSGPRAALLAALCWVAAFWFKQHGVLLGLGGMLYLTWRHGLRASVGPWILYLAAGPGIYWVAGNALFGPWFHEFTLEVPGRWMVTDPVVLVRLVGFLAGCIPLLALLALGRWAWALGRARERMDAPTFLYPFALATGILGVMDTDSSDNVLVGIGVWSLLVGMCALSSFWRRVDASPLQITTGVTMAAASAGLLAFTPSDVLPPRGAKEALADLHQVLAAREGSFYWPMDGPPLVDRERAVMEANWVPVEDLGRGPHPPYDAGLVLDGILAPLTEPDSTLYLLTRWPIEGDRVLGRVADLYRPAEDFESRFAALRGLRHRFGAPAPRYLYRRVSEPAWP